MQVMAKPVSRRAMLKGMLALPPLEAMFNLAGTAYAADGAAVETRFVFWFNGNGIPEKYWIPAETGKDFTLTPCLSPLAPFRNDVHILSGVDNAAAKGMGNGHTNSMSGLMTGTPFTGLTPSTVRASPAASAMTGRAARPSVAPWERPWRACASRFVRSPETTTKRGS